MSPTARTLEHLRREGWTCQVVEYWNAFARRRIDLFGCIDIIAVRGDRTIGIQCTTATHRSHRIAKAKATPAIQDWITAGNEMFVIDWRKPKGPAGKWVMTETKLTAGTDAASAEPGRNDRVG